jgi:hypothetical protein
MRTGQVYSPAQPKQPVSLQELGNKVMLALVVIAIVCVAGILIHQVFWILENPVSPPSLDQQVFYNL